MRKNNKRNGNFQIAQQVRRENEILEYGKLLSTRPSICHKSKKAYDRKRDRKIDMF